MSDENERKGPPLYMGDVLGALQAVGEVGLSNVGAELGTAIARLDFYEESTSMFFTVTWEGPMTEEEAEERGKKHREVLPIAPYQRKHEGKRDS